MQAAPGGSVATHGGSAASALTFAAFRLAVTQLGLTRIR